MLSGAILNVVMLNVTYEPSIQSVVMLNVVMLVSHVLFIDIKYIDKAHTKNESASEVIK